MKGKRLSDFNKRCFVSVVLIAVVALLVIFSSHPLVELCIVLIVSATAAVGVWEYCQLAIAKNLKPATRLMICVAIAEVVAFFIGNRFLNWPQFAIFVLVLGTVIFFIDHFKNPSDALLHVPIAFFGVCYVSVPLSLMLGILYPSLSGFPFEDGRWWLIYLIIITKITDIGAYFVGKLWGKHKLAPILSPKKTVEGAVAGFLCATITSVAMSKLGKSFGFGFANFSLIDALWLGMLVGVFAQVGDLAESLLKRDAVVKDSNTLPGLGGVLDMLDSLIFTSPIIYFFLKMR